MMSDNVLNTYIRDLLTSAIDEDKFEQYINMFSRFLGYTNSDYKYNGTYLSQYIDDFKVTYYALNYKNDKYDRILMKLIGLRRSFELCIDGVYKAEFSLNDNIEIKYLEFSKNKIISESIDVKVTIKHIEDEYLFCKEYWNLEDHLSERVLKDVKAFIKMKKIRRITNGTA